MVAFDLFIIVSIPWNFSIRVSGRSQIESTGTCVRSMKRNSEIIWSDFASEVTGFCFPSEREEESGDGQGKGERKGERIKGGIEERGRKKKGGGGETGKRKGLKEERTSRQISFAEKRFEIQSELAIQCEQLA